MTAHGHFAWAELNAHDPEGARRFCEILFNWTWEATAVADDSPYWVARCGGERAAGLFPLTAAQFMQVPDHWMSYLAVDDVDERAARVTAAGGTLIRAPWTVPGVGRLALLRLPGGAVMGLMTASG